MEQCNESVHNESDSDKINYRSLFISDLHLGTRGFQSDKFIEFLNNYNFERIIIVGDFIDIWCMKGKLSRYWPQQHTDVIRKLLKRSKKHPVIYVIGNHDEFCDNFFGSMGNITVCNKYVHRTADDRMLLVMHGHQFDYVTKHAKILAKLGSTAYSAIIYLNLIWNSVRQRLGYSKHWSLSSYIKKSVKNAVSYIFNFETTMATFVHNKKFHGIICGHIHTPAIKLVDGIQYYNCGDWVESCTALVEDHQGSIHLVRCWDGTEFIDADTKFASHA